MFDVGDSSNPLLSLKNDSKLRIAYEDPDKYDEYTNWGIGNKENIIASVLNWQTNRDLCKIPQNPLNSHKDI